jgi:hypothetical protein
MSDSEASFARNAALSLELARWAVIALINRPRNGEP